MSHHIRTLILVILLAIVAIWIAWPSNSGTKFTFLGQTVNPHFPIKEGLDLQGGMQVLLQAELPMGETITSESMQAAKQIIERRVNALGVAEPLIQIAEGNRIIVELPGVSDPDQAIKTFGETGLLEFIDAGKTPLTTGTQVTTSLGAPSTAAGAAAATPGAAASPTAVPVVYQTVIQGKDLSGADVSFDEVGRPEISFTLNNEGAGAFATYTSNSVGSYLAIALDKRIISSPQIQTPITEGKGRITGRFTLEEAKSLAIQLKYGSLPIPLKVIQNRTVGPTLGQDSLQKSLLAGIIGLAIVATFMIVNYRVPGMLATLALIIYTAISIALFKLIPVTLTLAGIAGFILSIGMAVDANILIFERMKEELRAGKSLRAAIDAGFKRAWTSIRDSNVSTLITCTILFWFGSTFGASIIQGFALTLAIGVLVSMFTAVFVSRTFLFNVVEAGLVHDVRWFGLFEGRHEPATANAPAPVTGRRVAN